MKAPEHISLNCQRVRRHCGSPVGSFLEAEEGTRISSKKNRGRREYRIHSCIVASGYARQSESFPKRVKWPVFDIFLCCFYRQPLLFQPYLLKTLRLRDRLAPFSTA